MDNLRGRLPIQNNIVRDFMENAEFYSNELLREASVRGLRTESLEEALKFLKRKCRAKKGRPRKDAVPAGDCPRKDKAAKKGTVRA